MSADEKKAAAASVKKQDEEEDKKPAEGEGEKDKKPEDQAEEEKSEDRVKLLVDAMKGMVVEKQQYESAFREITELITGKKDDKPGITTPELETMKKELATMREQFKLKEEMKELRAKLAEPAREPRGQPPTVGMVIPLGKSASASGAKRLSVKDSVELLIDHANKGLPLSKADWAAIGFHRS